MARMSGMSTKQLLSCIARLAGGMSESVSAACVWACVIVNVGVGVSEGVEDDGVREQ